MRDLDRRAFIAHAGAGVTALALAGTPAIAARHRRRRSGVPFARYGSFPEGVASGEPAPDGITLWTRLAGYDADRKLTLEVARDRGFGNVVYRRDVTARAERDHTLNVRVQGIRGLQPGERYWYRFETRGAHSSIGRFQLTRPPDSREPVRIAFISCMAYTAGYFGALRAIAEREDVDLVVCLGDYIYEQVFIGFDGAREDLTGANGDGEAQTLGEYRDKYRLYRSDEDLRALHAAHTFVPIWDDHEVEDNYAGEHAGDFTVDPRVPFQERRAAAYRAFFEYQPIRPVRGTRTRLYRTLRLGRTAELFLLDERQYRDDQPCGDLFLAPCPEGETDPRTMLGEEQKLWLLDALEASDASWKLVANPVPMMTVELGPTNTVFKDQWDGYGVERRELMGHIAERGIDDVAFMSGDIHVFYAGGVGVDGRGPESVATEFIGSSITSPDPAHVLAAVSGAVSADVVRLVTERITLFNPHLMYEDQRNRGYVVAEADDRELRVRFTAVDAVRYSTQARTLARFRVARGVPRVEQVF